MALETGRPPCLCQKNEINARAGHETNTQRRLHCKVDHKSTSTQDAGQTRGYSERSDIILTQRFLLYLPCKFYSPDAARGCDLEMTVDERWRQRQRGNRRRAAAAARRQQWRRRDGRGTAATISAHGELEIILFTSTCHVRVLGRVVQVFRPSIRAERIRCAPRPPLWVGGWDVPTLHVHVHVCSAARAGWRAVRRSVRGWRPTGPRRPFACVLTSVLMFHRVLLQKELQGDH